MSGPHLGKVSRDKLPPLVQKSGRKIEKTALKGEKASCFHTSCGECRFQTLRNFNDSREMGTTQRAPGAEENVDNGADETVQWTLTDRLNSVPDIASFDPQTVFSAVARLDNRDLAEARGRR